MQTLTLIPIARPQAYAELNTVRPIAMRSLFVREHLPSFVDSQFGWL